LFQHWPVDDAWRELVFGYATDGAGMTTHAFAQIDHHDPAAVFYWLLQRPFNVLLHTDEDVFLFEQFRHGFTSSTMIAIVIAIWGWNDSSAALTIHASLPLSLSTTVRV